MKLHRFIYIVLIALLLLNGVYSYRAYSTDAGVEAGAASRSEKGKEQSVEEQLEIMMQVLEMIKRNYVDGDKVTTRQLLTNAIQGMTVSLDPFSTYLPAQEYKELDEETQGSFGGIGIRIDTRDGKVTVVAPIQDTPAARAGILAGDEIVEIDGTEVNEIGAEQVSLALRGENGTKVTVVVRRKEGDEEKEITYDLIRAAIPVDSVEDVHVIEGTTIGYLRVLEFSMPTPKEFVEALKTLEKQAVTGLIIDLRNNPGGLLNSAQQMCSNLLPKGQLVVSVEGRDKQSAYQVNTEDGYKFPMDIPVVILINRGSASAAEIMSSCLNDYDRAGLVGEKSFGKGSVQNVIPFPDGSGLKLTVAKYFTKSRREIHGKGIQPEMERMLSREEYVKLYEIKDRAEWDKKDPHLAMALEYIRNYDGRPSVYRQNHPQGDSADKSAMKEDDLDAPENDAAPVKEAEAESGEGQGAGK